jgi:hypothetical protein
MADSGFWIVRQAECERYAEQFPELRAVWNAEYGTWRLWWGSTPDGLQVPAEPAVALNDVALKCSTQLPNARAAYKVNAGDPMMRLLDYLREFTQERRWYYDPIAVDRARRERRWGFLTERYRTWIANLKRRDPEDWVFPQDQDKREPIWDSAVRSALKKAASAEGCDFPGLGPHSLRRANITWRQEVGGSSIETSQIAGHGNTKITEEYTVVQLRRQEELTRRIQAKRMKAGKRHQGKVVEIKGADTAA